MVRKKRIMNKSGQVTIFIILAVIIVSIALLIYSFWPQIKTTLGGIQQENPPSYIQSCISDKMKSTVENISMQGGSMNPDNYLLFNNTEVEYLCYTNQYYVPCVIQQPMLKQHIESEIKNEISSDVDSCFNSLGSSYEGQGYDVNIKSGDKRVELLPNKIISTFNYSVTLTKGNDIQKYSSFIVVLNNNLYELTGISDSIIQWENAYGDSNTQAYMTYYPNLKVEKNLRASGERIYILTDRDTGNKFQFAVRSEAWPAGTLSITGLI